MDTIFLPLDINGNRFLNSDEQTTRRTIGLINGESYEVYLKFLNGTGIVSPAIDEFNFTVRQSLEGTDILSANTFSAGSGDYAWKFNLNCNSPFLSLALSGQESVDLLAQLAYTVDSELEVIAPVTARFTNAASGAGNNLAYVSSVNGVSGDVTLAGIGGVSVSQNGQTIQISGNFISPSQTGQFASAANLNQSGANLLSQINTLNGQTGNFYPKNNPSGFTTQTQLNNATGLLQNQITNLGNHTGDYYPRSNPSGFINSVDFSPYATKAELSGVSGLTNGVVRTMGNQTVGGEKTFADDIYAPAIRNANNVNISLVNGAIYDFNGDASLSFGGRTLNNADLTDSLDWGNRILSGNWRTNTVPSQSGHLVNFGFIQAYIAANANTGTLATAANLLATGSSLQLQINAANATISTLATQSGLNATGANLFNLISILNGQSGSWATTSALNNATGILGVRISAIEGATGFFATTANLLATGSSLQVLFNLLNSQTGNYYLRSNPSGFITSSTAAATYATKSELSTVSGLTNGVVRTAGAQNVNGTKTFLDNIVTPNIGNTSDLAGIGVNVKQLYDTDGVTSIWWHDRFLSDLAGGTALEWDARRLWNTSNGVTLDWNNRQLHGNWSATGTPTQNSHLINLGYLISYVATGLNTGGFATAANLTATGANLQSRLNTLSGNLNTSGAVLDAKIGILNNQSGQWYPASNPSGYLTTGTVASQSGLAATGANLQNQINSLNANVVFRTGNQTISGQKRFDSTILVDTLAGNTSSPILFSLSEGLVYDNDTEVPVVDFGNQILSATSGFANSLDWLNKFCYDSNGSLSVGWETRELYGTYGTGLNWQNGFLNNTGGLTTVAWHSENLLHNGVTTLDWSACQLVDTGSRNSLNWISRRLIATGGETRLDWQNSQLSGNWQTNTLPTLNTHLVTFGFLKTGDYPLFNVVRTTGNQIISGTKTFTGLVNVVDFNGHALTNLTNGGSVDLIGTALNDTAANQAMDWTTRVLYNADSSASVDWANRGLLNSSNNTSLDWQNNTLIDSSSILSLDWNNRSLADINEVTAIAWGNRELVDSSGNATLNWDTRQLTGNWSYQTLKGTVNSGATTSSRSIDWDTAAHFYQPITGSGISFGFTNTKEGQNITIVTLSTGSGVIAWPTGAQGCKLLWPNSIPFSGTSGSAGTPKRDVFNFLRMNNEILCSYSANHF